MSSCLAMTFKSIETPPSGGGVSCAVARPAAERVRNRNEKAVGTRRAPARTGMVIEFLCFAQGAPQRCRGEGSVGRSRLQAPGRCAGTEEDVEGKRTNDRRRPNQLHR